MAARCDDDMTALSAALDGSSVCSDIIRWSCVACVGELFFGVAPIKIRRWEYCRLMPLSPGRAPGGVGAGGERVDSYAYAWPGTLTFGSGC